MVESICKDNNYWELRSQRDAASAGSQLIRLDPSV